MVPEGFLWVRDALARLVAGEKSTQIAEDTGLPRSTLESLHADRTESYLTGDAGDDRLDTALKEIRPLDVLDEIDSPTIEELIRKKLRNRLHGQ